MLSFLSLLDPGDEILLPDPYFVMYRTFGDGLRRDGEATTSTYPDGDGERFRIDLDELESLVNERTKIVFVNSPSNPTGGVLTRAEIEGVCRIAERASAYVVSDEIYDLFCYDDDEPYCSPLQISERCIQLGGFSKSWGVPGWRMGYATGPADVLDALKTLQQFSFVCPPAPFQHALLEVMGKVDLSGYRDEYRQKRDFLASELHPSYRLSRPEGAFYAFPQLPRGADGQPVSSDAFIEAAVERKVLIVPGKAFSNRDTHFRISFAASDADLQKGVQVLNELAEQFA